MKLLGIAVLTAALLAPQTGDAQERGRKPGRVDAGRVASAAERAWPAFFAAFRAAVKRRDRAALKEMMAPDFLYSLGGGGGPDGAFEFWDADGGRGWAAFDRALSRGSAPQARWWNNGRDPERPGRVAPAAANLRANIERGRVGWYAVFEFREDGRWYCEIFQECCD